MNEKSDTTAPPNTASIATLADAVGGLESSLMDAVMMGQILALIVEETITVPDANGVVDIGDRADAITWAAYHSSNLMNDAFEKWRQASKLAFVMRSQSA